MKLLALAAVTAAAFPAVTPGELRPDLKELMAGGASGAVVLVRDDGARVTASAGSLHPGDRFRIGSITKSFVATVVLELVGEHRLTLDDHVDQWIPGLVPNGGRITIRQLLRHQSGIYNYANDPRLFKPYLAGRTSYYWSPRALVRLAVSHKPLFAPGAKWSYSNTNYILLGLIVEEVTGRSLAAELARRIFGPLGLHATSFGPGRPSQGRVAHSVVQGIDVAKVSMSWAWAAGAIVSTADDVARFYRALVTYELLSPPLLKQMETTVASPGGDYGLGVFVVRARCGNGWGHNGDMPGYQSIAFTSPDGKRQVVVLFTAAEIGEHAQAALSRLVVNAYCD